MQKLDSALFDAVKENKTSLVLELLKRRANPNANETFLSRGYIEYRRSVLHAALRVVDERGFGVDVPENTEIVSALLDNGADVDAKDTDGFTPLRLAALRGKRDTVHLLLDRGADINAKDLQGQTPLMMSVLSDNLLLIEELLQKGADVDVQNDSGMTALMLAVNYLHKAVERVPILLRYGANTKLTDRYDRTALTLLEHRLEVPNAVEVAEMLKKATV